MIQGKVLPGGEATIKISVRGPSGQIAQVEAMLDTGFNDEMTLPSWAIAKLGLEFFETGQYTLADGIESTTRVFRGYVEWLGIWRKVLIVQTEGDPLVGMRLLNGCNLSIDVIDGGNVKIQPLPLGFAPQLSLS